MKTFRYEIIKKSKAEADIQARYAQEIKELTSLGFGEMQYVREVVFPFSALVFFWMLPVLRREKEVFSIEWPLRVVRMYPVLIHRGYATYCVITGEGVAFLTVFTDGTNLRYQNYRDVEPAYNAEYQFYLYAPDKVPHPIEKAFDIHLDYVDELRESGHEPDKRLLMRTFEEMIQLNEKIALINLTPKKPDAKP